MGPTFHNASTTKFTKDILQILLVLKCGDMVYHSKCSNSFYVVFSIISYIYLPSIDNDDDDDDDKNLCLCG